MPILRIELLYPPHTGRVIDFDDQAISFGRAAENTLTIEVPQASRDHGNIYYEDGRWFCANESPNGTCVNGKRIKKPIALKHGDAIGIDKVPMFRVLLPTEASHTDPSLNQQAQVAEPVVNKLTPEEAAARKRIRLWTGIAVYMVIMLVVIIVLDQVSGDGNQQGVQAAKQLTPAQITSEITRPFTRPKYERDAAQQLAKARSLFKVRQVEPRNRYDAFVAYKEALAFSGKPVFENGIVHREFQAVESEIVEVVNRTYRQAYALLRSRQYEAATQEFGKLIQDIYPDSRSKIYRNANAQLAIARRKASR